MSATLSESLAKPSSVPFVILISIREPIGHVAATVDSHPLPDGSTVRESPVREIIFTISFEEPTSRVTKKNSPAPGAGNLDPSPVATVIVRSLPLIPTASVDLALFLYSCLLIVILSYAKSLGGSRGSLEIFTELLDRNFQSGNNRIRVRVSRNYECRT